MNGFVNSVIDLEAKRDTTRVDTSVTARDVVQCVSNRHPDDDGTDQTSLSVPQSTPCKLICVATLETPPPRVRSQDSRNHFTVERATPCSWESSASTGHWRHWRRRLNTLLSHTSIPKNVCATSTCCTSGLSTPCSWEPRASNNHVTSLFLGTRRHHGLAERNRRASGHHAVNDDIGRRLVSSLASLP